MERMGGDLDSQEEQVQLTTASADAVKFFNGSQTNSSFAGRDVRVASPMWPRMAYHSRTDSRLSLDGRADGSLFRRDATGRARDLLPARRRPDYAGDGEGQ